MPNRLIFCSLAFAALLAACSGKSPETAKPAADAAAAAHGDGIAWRTDVDRAFAEAKAANKPVFLYWGAVWCPPCQQVKSTIFQQPEFIERTRLVIPVYIDGDSPSAQMYGDRFGVVGYPTVVVLRADGTEVTRLPGGVDIDLYTSVLDAAIANMKPVKDLIAAVDKNPASLSAADWHVLAYYAWDVDADRLVDAKQAPAVVKNLYEKCQPASVSSDCIRLHLTLAAMIAAEKEHPTVALDKPKLVATLRDLRNSSSLIRQNIDYIVYHSDDLVTVATAAGSPQRAELVKDWQSMLDTLGNDESLPRVDRVGMVYARVLLSKADQPKAPVPADVVAAVRERTAWADKATIDPYERQAVVNRAAAALDEAGLGKDANDMLTRELKISKSPYYFMLDIADFEQKAGHNKEALQWLERAYNESKGPATRFQWGVNYLLGVIEMAPEDDERIQRVGLAVIDELKADKDSLHQRSRIRLERIDQALQGWNKGDNHRPVVRALRARLEEICAPVADSDSARKTCDGFLASS